MSKRILLITPVFYGIENKIREDLENSGYEVVWIENKALKFDYHATRSKLRFLRRIYFFIFFPIVRHIKRELKKVSDTRFDILFSINGFIICSELFKILKKKNPEIHSILYLWDSFSMYNWTKELKHFDRVFTYDPNDSVLYNLEHKPNFFLKNDQKRKFSEEYDIFFAGKFSPFRLSVLDKITGYFEDCGINYCVSIWPGYKIFPHNRLVYLILKKIKIPGNWVKRYLLNFEAVEGILKRGFIMENSLSYDEMKRYFSCSNVILDISYQEQTAHPHRLIEALAHGKKIITTNSNIRKESFFNSEQIQIIDVQNVNVDCEWIKERSTFQIDNNYSELELSPWLKSLVNVETA